MEFSFSAKAGGEGKIFGSNGPDDIVRAINNEVDKHKSIAQYHLEWLRDDPIRTELKKLPKQLSRAGPVLILRRLPICCDAMMQCLGSLPNSSEFNICLEFSKKITEWLLETLHIADEILERHFKKRAE